MEDYERSKWFYFNAEVKSLDIAQYSKWYEIYRYDGNLAVKITSDKLAFTLDGKEYQFDFAPYAEKILADAEMRRHLVQPLMLDVNDARLVVTSMNGEQSLSGGLEIESFQAFLLVK